MTGAAVIGSGNVGTDLMIKLLRGTGPLRMSAMAGVDPTSSQYLMPGNCARAYSSWPAHSRGQPKARAAWLLMSAAAAPLVKWMYSPQFIRRV